MKRMLKLALASSFVLFAYLSSPPDVYACDTCIQNCLYGYCGIPPESGCEAEMFPICEQACCG